MWMQALCRARFRPRPFPVLGNDPVDDGKTDPGALELIVAMQSPTLRRPARSCWHRIRRRVHGQTWSQSFAPVMISIVGHPVTCELGGVRSGCSAAPSTSLGRPVPRHPRRPPRSLRLDLAFRADVIGTDLLEQGQHRYVLTLNGPVVRLSRTAGGRPQVRCVRLPMDPLAELMFTGALDRSIPR